MERWVDPPTCVGEDGCHAGLISNWVPITIPSERLRPNKITRYQHSREAFLWRLMAIPPQEEYLMETQGWVGGTKNEGAGLTPEVGDRSPSVAAELLMPSI